MEDESQPTTPPSARSSHNTGQPRTVPDQAVPEVGNRQQVNEAKGADGALGGSQLREQRINHDPQQDEITVLPGNEGASSSSSISANSKGHFPSSD